MDQPDRQKEETDRDLTESEKSSDFYVEKLKNWQSQDDFMKSLQI